MSTIQPPSPKAQRELLQRGSKGMVYADRGSINSRAAPAAQDALRAKRAEARKKMLFKSLCAIATLFIMISLVSYLVSKKSEASWDVLPDAKSTTQSDQPALMVVDVPKTVDPRTSSIDYSSSAREFLDRAKVNGVRFGGDNTRAIINGDLYHVGDVVVPELGLVLVGHDPDGEYLLFQDADSRTILLRVNNNEAG